MKTEDFERLKAICEKEGFELITDSTNVDQVFFTIKKKRIKIESAKSECWMNDLKTLTFKFNFNIELGKNDYKNVFLFISEQLEKYLNEEIE